MVASNFWYFVVCVPFRRPFLFFSISFQGEKRERERAARSKPPSITFEWKWPFDPLPWYEPLLFFFSYPKNFFSSLYNTQTYTYEKKKKHAAEGERDVGGGPRIGGDGLSPAILYTPSKNRRRKFSLFYFFSSFPRPFKVGKLLLAWAEGICKKKGRRIIV